MSENESHSHHSEHHSSEHHHSHHGEHHHSHHDDESKRYHHHHYFSEKLSSSEKKHVMKKLQSFIRSIKRFKKNTHSDDQFQMEVRRYFYDNFHGFERHWLRHHCPIVKRIKLYFMGVNIRKLH